MAIRQTAAVLKAIDSGLQLLPESMDSREARLLMGAIALQESKGKHRWQILNVPGLKGPARGLWQFERGGGVTGVMQHPRTRNFAKAVCDQHGIPFVPRYVHSALEVNDVLAAVFARLLLWSDPRRLPPIGNISGAWDCYERNWRPGKAKPMAWPENYAAAVAALGDIE